MNYLIFLELLGCSLFGQLIHLLIKAKAIKARNDSAGLGGNPFSELIQKDYINIMLSLVANVALLIIFKNTKSTTVNFGFLGADISFDWRYFLFIFSGYTGSSFVLSLFSKVDSLQKEKLNNISILTPNKMEDFIWQMTFENSDDLVEYKEGIKSSLTQFASDTAGTLSGKVITYDRDPGFGHLTIWRVDGTTYLSGPVRKPTIW